MTASNLTAAKAAAAATAADLESIAHRLEQAKAAATETTAELSAILAADAAGEAEAVAHDVAVLKSESDLRTSRVVALSANLARATEANHQATIRLRAEAVKASKTILSTGDAERLAEEAQTEVQAILRKLAERLQAGADSNAEALAEVKQLVPAGAANVHGLAITGDVGNAVLAIDGKQFFTFTNVTRAFSNVAKDAATALTNELAAPREAARAAKFAADDARDAKYKAELRAYQERNTERIDFGALAANGIRMSNHY